MLNVSLCKKNYHPTNFILPYKEINMLLHGSNGTIDKVDMQVMIYLVRNCQNLKEGQHKW